MEYAIQRSTNKKLKPLKLKHVASFLDGDDLAERWILTRNVPALVSTHPRAKLGGGFKKHIIGLSYQVVFKSLILVHILIREGATDRVLQYLVGHPVVINTSGFRDKSLSPLSVAQSKNIRSYSQYLEEKVAGYRDVKDDFVRSKPEYIAKFRSMPQETLLREVQVLQRQIDALLGCSFYLEEIDNVVTLQAFRLLIGDMMALFHLMNEGVIRILGCYFDMEKSEAQKALQIYKSFAQQTTRTVEFFDIARKLKSSLGIDVPIFKHAPISLVSALEDYIKAPDFEAQRRAYREKKSQANLQKTPEKSSAKATPKVEVERKEEQGSRTVFDAGKDKAKAEPLIDFFSSLDDELNTYTKQPQANFSVDLSASIWSQPAATPQNPFGVMPAGFATTPGFATPGAPSAAANNQMVLHPFASTATAGQGLYAPAAQALPTGTNGSSQLVLHPFASTATAGQGLSNLSNQNGTALNAFQTTPAPSSAVNPFAVPNFSSQPKPFSNDPSFTIENVFGQQNTFAQQQPMQSNPFPTSAFANPQANSQPFGAAPQALSQPFGTTPQSNLQFGASGQSNPQPFGGAMNQGPTNNVGIQPITDHLASLNPFSKPTVPLAAMGATANTANSNNPFLRQ
ncbi:hypothetical protein HDU97_009567 [Phlyctochytrium planicorne]|nr:hypothetical protein HDU97_009567 [Phlyctochytrium planicorne]